MIKPIKALLGRHLNNQRGSVLIIACLIFAMMPPMLGLIYDIYNIQVQKTYMQSVADAAALAGAMGVDEASFKSSRGTKIQHNSSDVESKVSRYISYNNNANPKYTISQYTAPTINQTKHSVFVKVQMDIPTVFTRFAGFTSKRITTDGEAAVLVKNQ